MLFNCNKWGDIEDRKDWGLTIHLTYCTKIEKDKGPSKEYYKFELIKNRYKYLTGFLW